MSSSAITFNTAGLASASSAGLVSTSAQTFGGDKTFNGNLTLIGNLRNSVGSGNHSSNIGTLSTSVGFYRANITVATVALLGIAGGVDGRVIVVTNVGSATGDVRNEDAGASASDRIITGTGASLNSWLTNGSVTLIYDGTSQRWRVINTYRCS